MKKHEIKEGLVKFVTINELLCDILRDLAGNEPDEEYIRGRIQKLNALITSEDNNCFVAQSEVGDNHTMLSFKFSILAIPTLDYFTKVIFGGGDETDD